MSGYPLSSLSVPPSTQRALQKAGYVSSSDLEGVSAESLSKELGISANDASAVLGSRSARPVWLPQSTPASSLLKNAATFHVLPSLPFLPSSLIELCGPPGSGKTRIAMSVLRKVLESGQEAVVADVDGSMAPARLLETATEWESRGSHPASSLTRSVQITSIPDLTTLLAFLLTLPSFLAEHPKIKLLIIDGLAVPFRHPPLTSPQRQHALTTIKSSLQRLSAIPIAVLFTTQVATKLISASNTPSTSDDANAKAVLQPALGDSWMSGRFARVMLTREGANGDRVAYIARDGSTTRVEFQLNDDGLCMP